MQSTKAEARNRSSRRLRRNYLTYVGLFFLCIAIAVMMICSLQQVATRQLITNLKDVGRTYETIYEIELVISSLKDAETGQRGYLLTNEPAYLEPYSAALRSVESQMDKLATLIQSNPGQQGRFTEMTGLVNDKLKELAETIRLSKAGERATALEYVRSGVGKATMDKIRGIYDLMSQEELWLLNRRSGRLETFVEIVIRSSWIIQFVILAVLVVCWWVIQRENDRRLDAERKLQYTVAQQGYTIQEASGLVEKYIDSSERSEETIQNLLGILRIGDKTDGRFPS